eukprot:CAMPEP_0118659614 /NCGR_PEP_ID=MMETSP0785-20121206/15211_1 /TAXON_ID=91992 /ORGANISM="Bolidomonas pacifica, Strain CCMP 1866" /LENGTH=374 /DNA_ID=CAMNT_0006552741 /DNA_START=17 /DNA_END=1138 /DNA_ORIENTATION=+
MTHIIHIIYILALISACNSYIPTLIRRPHRSMYTFGNLPNHIRRPIHHEYGRSNYHTTKVHSLTPNYTQLPSNSRKLGSQELLFLSRPYTTSLPQTNHCVYLSIPHLSSKAKTTTEEDVNLAMREVLKLNPILRTVVVKSGDVERVDLMKMVREGNEEYTFSEVVSLSDLNSPTMGLPLWSSSITHLPQPFKPSEFQTLLDAPIYPPIHSSTPTKPVPLLWSLFTFPSGTDFVFRFNHAVSDQGTFQEDIARVFARELRGGGGEGREKGVGIDGIRGNVESMFYSTPPLPPTVPPNGIKSGLSILGLNSASSFSPRTLKYITKKALESAGKDVRLRSAGLGTPVPSTRSSVITNGRLSLEETAGVREAARREGV